jgi:hypothetical protein
MTTFAYSSIVAYRRSIDGPQEAVGVDARPAHRSPMLGVIGAADHIDPRLLEHRNDEVVAL